MALRYKENDFALSINGNAVITGTGAMPTGFEKIFIGCNYAIAGQLFGEIKELRILNTGLTNAELQEFSGL